MSSACGLLVGVTIAVVLQSDLRAINVAPGLGDIDRAMKLAQERPDTRDQFHSPYIVRLLNHPTVEAIDVITEFRRYVLTAEKELRLGHWLFAQGTREAQAAVQPWHGQLSMVARLRFHPQNTLMAVPPYKITIGRPDLAAVDVIRTPITALPSGKRGDLATPLIGATIEALFDAAPVGQTVRPVMVMLAGDRAGDDRFRQTGIAARMSLFHHLDLRVMWPDTDPAGIVWFGVFFRYFEYAEEDLYRRLGSDRTALLRALNVFMPRTSLQTRFRSPAKLGDELSVGVEVSKITDRRIGFAFDIRERGTERLICDASYRVACVDAKTFAPQPFPPQIATLLRTACSNPVDGTTSPER